MITQQVVYWIYLFQKNYRLIAIDSTKRKAFKSNSTDHVYWKIENNSSKYNNNYLLHWTIKRNNTWTLKRNSKSCVSTNKWLNSEENFQLPDYHLRKLKNAAKNKTGTTLRMSLKMLSENNSRHESLLATRQEHLRNAFENSMSTDVKLSKA